MLLNTFIHIPTIGIKTERLIWKQGISNWYDFLKNKPDFMSHEKYLFCCEEIREGISNISNPVYFAKKLPKSEHWRLYEAYSALCAYLDIETNSREDNIVEVTVIGIYDGENYTPFVSGKNLEEFEAFISKFMLVVTFSGNTFDLPMLQKTFPNVYIPPIQIDLKYVLRKLGIRGGLKKVEELFCIERPPDIKGLNGYHALLLWRQFENNNDESCLNLLIRYNEQDCINLKPLMDACFERLKRLYIGDIFR